MQAALLGELRGATDPTRTPAQNTDEVLAARSSFGSLNLRLTDWEARQYVQPYALRNGFVLGNQIANDSFLSWGRGEALAPDYWTLSGAGAAIVRDTTTFLTPGWGAKLTFGSAAAVLTQEVVSTAAGALLAEFFGTTKNTPVDSAEITIPGYELEAVGDAMHAYLVGSCWSSSVGIARLRLNAPDVASVAVSSYHPGDGDWHGLLAGPLNADDTFAGARLLAECRVEGAGFGIFQNIGLMFVPAGLAPMWVPGRMRLRELTYYVNNPATGVLTYLPPLARPAFVVGAQMQCLTAGTVTAPTIDLLTPIGGVYSSLFATLPTIATGQLVGAPQVATTVSANYRRRTMRPCLAASATQLDNTGLRLDYVDDGGGTLRDLMVTVYVLEFDRPLEQFRSMTDVGE